MSSHREAPEISKDPVADNTDVYAFVSPDKPDSVTLIANYIPLEDPAGGPNFFQFGDDVLYEIYVDNNGDGVADVTYQFRFSTTIKNPNSFLYNVGPIQSLNDNNWNLRQSYSVTRVRKMQGMDETVTLGKDIPCPPSRIGPRSTPNYPALANAAIMTLGNAKVFAGQREEAFFVDLGSIFDLGTLRPFQNLHLIPTAAAMGRDGTKGFNVHTIALQVPKTDLTADGSNPSDAASPRSVIGVWAAASRQKSTVRNGKTMAAGPWVQVSRLANPLINEVIIPLGKKDGWNQQQPKDDAQFLSHYQDPELQNLLPVLYPNVFPKLGALLEAPVGNRPRADLVAILLTGIPAGVIPGFQNFTGPTQADMLRLNMAIAPSPNPSPFGLLGNDPAGFPNGRRVTDDVVSVELRAVAGATLPLVNPNFTADAAASQLTDGTKNDMPPLASFPYLGHPHEGYNHAHD
jgi:Domain of unknown function (DUF4331)